MDIISYILSRKYTDNSIIGLGAIKGANCTISNIVHQDGINTVTFKWTGTDGTEKTRDMIVYDGTPIYTYEVGDTYHYGDLVIYKMMFYRCIVSECVATEDIDLSCFDPIGTPDGDFGLVQSKDLLPTRFTSSDRKLYFVLDEDIFYYWDGSAWLPQTNLIQYATLPTASEKYLGKIVQYIGETNANYTHGFMYKCISDGADPATYSWQNILVQDTYYVTPQMFGAKGDGVTDDSAAIQAALNHRGVVYFPKGIYNVLNLPLKVTSNTTIVGDKGQSIVKIDDTFATPTVHLFEIGTAGYPEKNITIQGMTFRGSETYGTSEYGATLITCWGTSNVLIQDCLFQNNKYSAIQLAPSISGGVKTGCSNVTVINSRFEAVDCGIVSGDATTSDITIRGCFFSGLSSYNNFTNFYSEQIATFATSEVAEPNTNWVVEDCIFEHKSTNPISFTSHGSVPNNQILNKNISIRNCTIRDCVGGILLSHAEDIVIDGVFNDESEIVVEGRTTLYRFLDIQYSNNITVRNLTNDSKYCDSPFYIANSNNVLTENIDSYVDYKPQSSTLPFMFLNTCSKLTIKGFNIKPIDSNNKEAVVRIDNVTDSYINIHGDTLLGSEVKYVELSGVTNTGNIYVIDTDNNVSRDSATRSMSTVEANKYVLNGNGILVKQDMNQIYAYTLPRVYRFTFYTQPNYDSALAIANFYLLNNGVETTLEFVNTSFTTGKTFTFATGGNIVAIPRSFAFSDDYKVVCKFKQIKGKWVETQRLLEYYEGATIDVTEGSLGTAAFKNSTDRVSPNNTDLVESQSVYSAINTALSSIYTPRGDITCAELTSSLLIAANVGNVYELSDSGTTSALFLQGAGITLNAGDNVGIINAGEGRILFNLMANAFDLTDYQKKDLTTPLTIGGVSVTTVEGALSALNDEMVEFTQAELLAMW